MGNHDDSASSGCSIKQLLQDSSFRAMVLRDSQLLTVSARTYVRSVGTCCEQERLRRLHVLNEKNLELSQFYIKDKTCVRFVTVYIDPGCFEFGLFMPDFMLQIRHFLNTCAAANSFCKASPCV